MIVGIVLLLVVLTVSSICALANDAGRKRQIQAPPQLREDSDSDRYHGSNQWGR